MACGLICWRALRPHALRLQLAFPLKVRLIQLVGVRIKRSYDPQYLAKECVQLAVYNPQAAWNYVQLLGLGHVYEQETRGIHTWRG